MIELSIDDQLRVEHLETERSLFIAQTKSAKSRGYRNRANRKANECRRLVTSIQSSASDHLIAPSVATCVVPND